MTAPTAVRAWVKYVRLLNLLTALIQLLAGIGSLTQILSLDIPATFIAVYVMLFALLLLAYECRFSSIDAFLLQNFGFLYSFRGLGAYLLFIGLLDFGMAGGLFGYVAGASACFTAFVLLSTSLCATATPADSSSINKNSERLPTYGSSAFEPPLNAVAKPAKSQPQQQQQPLPLPPASEASQPLTIRSPPATDQKKKKGKAKATK